MLKPEYEEIYLIQMNPKAKSFLLNYHKRQQKRRCNIYIFSTTFFINTSTPSKEAPQESYTKMAPTDYGVHLRK